MGTKRAFEEELYDMKQHRTLSEADLELVNTLTVLSAGGSPTHPAPQPKFRDSLLTNWQASILAQAGPSPSEAERARNTSAPSSPTKRTPAQVVRLGEGRWQCIDGTIWPSQPSAYRHLKDVKNQSLAEQADEADQESDERTTFGARRALDLDFAAGTMANQRARERRIKVHGHAIDLGRCNPTDPSLYELARAWTLDAARMPPTGPALTRMVNCSLSPSEIASTIPHFVSPVAPPAPPQRVLDWTIESIADPSEIKQMADIKTLRTKYLTELKQIRSQSSVPQTSPARS